MNHRERRGHRGSQEAAKRSSFRRLGSRLALALLWIAPLLPGIAPRAEAQTAEPFPRALSDETGHVVIIPAYPQTVAVLGEVPGLEHLVAADDLRAIDPAQPPAHWTGIGLMVTPALYAAAYAPIIAAAQAEGVPIYQTGLISSLDGWRAAIAARGRATGRDTRAADLLARFERAERTVSARVAGRAPVRVLALTPEAYTFGAGTLFSDLVALAGGTNAPSAAGYADFRQLDDSALRALAPEVILLTPGWGESAASSARDTLLALPAYAGIPAIESGRVFVLPFDPTQPGDPGTALWMLAVLIHPAILLPPRL